MLLATGVELGALGDLQCQRGGANSQTPYSHGTRRRGLGQQVAVSLQFRPAWTPQAWLPSEPLPTRADPAGEKWAWTLSLGRLSLEVGSPHLKRG